MQSMAKLLSSVGNHCALEQSGCWVTMVMFLLLPELTKVWDTWGCPMCWEPRALSFVDRALCLLCCWLRLFSGDVSCHHVYVTAEPEWCFSCLGITARRCDRLRATQGTRAALPRGKTNLSYFKWVKFLSKYVVYKSRHMNKDRNMYAFSSTLKCCSKRCQKSVVLP